MRLIHRWVTAIAIGLGATTAAATVYTFDTDPFAGSTALTTPGRQIVGGEVFIEFSPAVDVFAFNPAVFDLGGSLQVANGLLTSLPTSGANVLILQTLDNDNDDATVFNAGLAANLIASHVTSPGAGFFIYFNSAFDLPRLVYSTDLDDNTADLKILARLTNLGGQAGRDALASFGPANFTLSSVPEPSTLWLLALPALLVAAGGGRSCRLVKSRGAAARRVGQQRARVVPLSAGAG